MGAEVDAALRVCPNEGRDHPKRLNRISWQSMQRLWDI